MRSRAQRISLCAGLTFAVALPVVAARTAARGYYRKDGAYARGYAKEVSGSRRARMLPEGGVYNTLTYRQLGLERDGKVEPGADLRQLRLPTADFSRAALPGVDLTGAMLEGGRLGAANLEEALLSGARLRAAKLAGALLNDADLIRADLEGADLARVWAADARLDGARLRRAVLLEAQLAGVSLIGADLTEASLEGAKLARGHLQLADLTGANLTQTDLRGADLSSAKLENTVLTGALYSASTEWPVGFNPGAAGALLKDDPAEEAPAAAQSSEARKLSAQLHALIENGDLAGAEKLAGQLSDLLRKEQRQARNLRGRPPVSPPGIEAPEAEVLEVSPTPLRLPGGITGKIYFPSGTAYLIGDVPNVPGGNCSSAITVRLDNALGVENKLFKVGDQVVNVSYASSNKKIVEIDDQGRLFVNRTGQAKLLVRAAGAEWVLPINAVHLPIHREDSQANVVKKMGLPDRNQDGYWSWRKYPSLWLRVGPPHAVYSDWNAFPTRETREGP